MDFLRWLVDMFNGTIDLPGGQVLVVREVVGNVFGLASALGGMRRKVWAWPIGIAGNLLLLTVFLGSLIDPNATMPHLLGQAGRQIMFIVVSVYGWVRWNQSRKQRGAGASQAITPRWGGWGVRVGMLLVMVIGTVALTPLFAALGSYDPVWADAWTFIGSLVATYGMAKGWTEFWLAWVAVDIVGVPLLFSAGYFASAFMYLFYGVFTLIGFFVWARAQKNEKPSISSMETLDPTVE
ncbi:nicotinamide riboside transporter PnuC [Pseudoglutamicibacter cumminsii]|uniref:Nicotinamide mononucleotide transporter n=1 Tax=Pseudoglutamicibacter cumminsii TaxID=156979 RepID=A0ABX5L8N0_9MICC|nr:nicotinamide riboside transporter PnuC [Pseudoglutamicibacter cumminsii]MDZ3745877.1 nicotinamide riboside transporter PnuC [Pseudoglutamicibacter cumminsii]PWI28574.1 hypothetical protein CAY35_00420 [Pseudoglutamicibacter cumminsii]